MQTKQNPAPAKEKKIVNTKKKLSDALRKNLMRRKEGKGEEKKS